MHEWVYNGYLKKGHLIYKYNGSEYSLGKRTINRRYIRGFILSLIHIEMCIRDSVNSAFDAFQNVHRCTYTHQITRLVLRQYLICLLYTSRCV